MQVFQFIEAVEQRCSIKKVFLEILENSQENTCARASFFNKVEGLWRLLFKNVFQSATSFVRFMSD